MSTAPKKSLGQHFLTAPAIAARMVHAAALSPGETVIEIGPGRGVLTKELLAAGCTVIAFEKDEALAEEIAHTFAQEVTKGTLSVYACDARTLTRESLHTYVAGNYKIVANIPYYITGELLRQFLSLEPLPQSITLVVQYEVAQRIIAKDGKGSILSISITAYGTPRLIRRVAAGSFYPQPRVDSALLTITAISRERFSLVSEETFFNVVKKGFAQKRKLLKNNLGCGEETLATCGIAPTARAEELTVHDWFCVSTLLK